MDTHGENPQNHQDRQAALRKYYRTSLGFGPYYRLRKRADAVRYLGYVPRDLSKDWADLQLVEQQIV